LFIRKILAGILLASVAVVIGILYWQTEIQYLLPTPVPKGYQEVFIDEKIYVTEEAQDSLEKPVFYHFFSTSCSCSRFNLDHFNYLKRQFGDDLEFVIVLPQEDDLNKARPYFDGETKIIQDLNSEFAVATGVYSTPQAVIINKDRSLYFRGNYNKARYCTDPTSNFAQMALDSLMEGVRPPDFGPLSTIAYGCGIEYSLSL